MEKYNLKKWPYKFYGVWKEYRKEVQEDSGGKTFPSIFDFVNEAENALYDKKNLLEYLSNGYRFSSIVGWLLPSPFDINVSLGDYTYYMTDGEWIWSGCIIYHIEYDGLLIPEDFYEHIKNKNFIIDKNADFTEDEINELWSKIE